MTLDDALAELGIDHEISSDGARRAYLRLLKTRKPETDPEGFMRLREAYELVKAELPFLEAFRAQESEIGVARVEIDAAKIEVDAVEVEVSAAKIESPAVALEVAAADLQAPAVDESSPAPAAEPVVAPDLGDVSSMEALLARSAYRKAAKQALLILAAATTRFDAPQPPVVSCLRLMLGLHQIPEPAKAREVSAAFKAWLVASGQESAQIRGHAAVLWTLVRELDGMKKGLPDRVRTAIAAAALAGDLDLAREDLVSFRVNQRPVARTAGGLLRRQAPVIGAALADTLDPPPPPAPVTPHRRQDSSMKGFGVLAFVLLGIVRLLFASARGGSDPPPRSFTIPSYTMPTLSSDAGGSPSERREALRKNIRIRGNTLWSLSDTHGRIKLRAAASVVALGNDDCPGLLGAMADIRAEAARTKETIGSVTESVIVSLAADIDRYCEDRLDAGVSVSVSASIPEDAGVQDSGRRRRVGK